MIQEKEKNMHVCTFINFRLFIKKKIIFKENFKIGNNRILESKLFKKKKIRNSIKGNVVGLMGNWERVGEKIFFFYQISYHKYIQFCCTMLNQQTRKDVKTF